MRKISIICTALLSLSLLFSSCEKAEDTVRTLPDVSYEVDLDGRPFTPGFNSAIVDVPDQANPLGAMRITGIGYKDFIEENGEINYNRYIQESIIIDLLGYKKGTYIMEGPNVMAYGFAEYINDDIVSNKVLTVVAPSINTSFVEITEIDEVDNLISGFYQFYVEDIDELGEPFIARYDGTFNYIRYSLKDLPF